MKEVHPGDPFKGLEARTEGLWVIRWIKKKLHARRKPHLNEPIGRVTSIVEDENGIHAEIILFEPKEK